MIQEILTPMEFTSERLLTVNTSLSCQVMRNYRMENEARLWVKNVMEKKEEATEAIINEGRNE